MTAERPYWPETRGSMIETMQSEPAMAHQIYQASGMIAVQSDSTIAEALVLLAIRAETLDQDMETTAVQVLDRRLTFDHRGLLGRRSGSV